MLSRLVLATQNAHKLAEVRAMLAPLGITVIGGGEAGLVDVPENGTTFAENALIKARAGFQQTGMPTLADDSGLCIAAMGDAPGIRSARFASEHGGYPAVFDVVQRLIGDNPDRSAYFMCCLALVTEDGAEHVFTGRVDGTIARTATGTHLFGYDPIFVPTGYDASFGALDEAVKNRISHRARAMCQLVDFLSGR